MNNCGSTLVKVTWISRNSMYLWIPMESKDTMQSMYIQYPWSSWLSIGSMVVIEFHGYPYPQNTKHPNKKSCHFMPIRKISGYPWIPMQFHCYMHEIHGSMDQDIHGFHGIHRISWISMGSIDIKDHRYYTKPNVFFVMPCH